MGGVQPPASLIDDIDHVFDGEARAAVANQAVERHSRKHRHDEKRLRTTVFFEFADIVDPDDVGVNHGRQDAPLFVEELG